MSEQISKGGIARHEAACAMIRAQHSAALRDYCGLANEQDAKVGRFPARDATARHELTIVKVDVSSGLLKPPAHWQSGSRHPPPGHSGDILALRHSAIVQIDVVTLVAMLVEQDPWAQRIVWQRFEPMVRRMLRRAFRSKGEVDDLVQDIFLGLFMRVHALRDPHLLKAYVIGITVGTIRSFIKRKMSARLLYVREPPDAITAPADLGARQALQRLRGILHRLSSADRKAFILRFIEGKKLSEISVTLGFSLATTKRHIARARGRVAFHSRRDPALVDYVAHCSFDSLRGDRVVATRTKGTRFTVRK